MSRPRTHALEQLRQIRGLRVKLHGLEIHLSNFQAPSSTDAPVRSLDILSCLKGAPARIRVQNEMQTLRAAYIAGGAVPIPCPRARPLDPLDLWPLGTPSLARAAYIAGGAVLAARFWRAVLARAAYIAGGAVLARDPWIPWPSALGRGSLTLWIPGPLTSVADP
jgi:hypothetical protein